MTGTAESPETPPLDTGRILVLFGLGVLAGVLGGLIGIGGSTIMLPVMYFSLGFPETIAIGTGLFVVIFTSFSGGYGHIVRKNADTRVAVRLALGGVAGVLLGSWLFTLLANETDLLGLILGVVFLVPAVNMIREGLFSRESAAPAGAGIGGSTLAFTGFGVGVGVLTGLTGLGGGFALVPGLIYLFGAPVYVTMGTSLAAILPMAIIGGGIKLAQGYVALGAAVILAMGSVIGAQTGAAVIRYIPPGVLKLLFGLYFAYASIRFIAEYLGIALP
ncbi:permease [Methanoculleus taiwanensis]|uniref:Probable membrane transporter protein n=1 Tax=Methanoculleus taiwanensis TaxID=1550565 RepID=A0A498H4T6_9EURY|nr:permease [Methanoculleus taiwanensis]